MRTTSGETPLATTGPLGLTHSHRPSSDGRATGGGLYLLVVEESSSRSFSLPIDGAALIGRGPEADLQLEDKGASRRHARLIVSEGQVHVSDLDSRNGTRVNDQVLKGARVLSTGDVVTIGGATLILRGRRPSAQGRRLLEPPALSRRLEEEIERALGSETSFAIALFGVAGQPPIEGVARVIDPELRLMDVAGWSAPGELVVVLPGPELEGAREIADRVLAALSRAGVSARAGVAAYPASGCDPHTLMEAARAMAGRTAVGKLADTAAAIRLEIGDRKVIVADPAMVRLFDLVRRLAACDLPVLIRGETGAGKENAAFALHQWSARAAGPFVAINCAALPETLIESELFGHEKGAFSGGAGAKPGLLETAAGGTVFLDELGELPRSVQPKLLRVLETRQVMRLGATRERALDIRLVAATNRNLEEEVKAGRFRQDLLFRVNAATVVLPPLRDRPAEIGILAQTFLQEACDRLARPRQVLSPGAVHVLGRHPWPGNVRELKNVIEFLAATAPGPVIERHHLEERLNSEEQPPPSPPEPSDGGPQAVGPGPRATPATAAYPPPGRLFSPIAEELRALEMSRMREALELSGWVQTKAAELIGMPLRTFQQRVKQYGLARRPDSTL